MRLILTYHGLNATGWAYENNDHIALWHDLGALERVGYAVVPLSDVVSAIKINCLTELPDKAVAITFDDGVDHDYHDFFHPEAGLLPSFKSILSGRRRAGFEVSGTSFVIASPTARSELDHACIAGRDQWRDSWWNSAAACPYMDIANHSWDHNHPALSERVLSNRPSGKFNCIETHQDAHAEIELAHEYIAKMTNELARPWFAFPYGEFSDFLIDEYLPGSSVEAAFTANGAYLDDDVNIYKIPRFVCGDHWKSPSQFIKLLMGSMRE